MQAEILILDYGSQYTQLLAQRIRDLHFYVEIVNPQITHEELQVKYPNLKLIILSGGPQSVYENSSLSLDRNILAANYVILGVCYGMQLLVHLTHGQVALAEQQEFGLSTLELHTADDPFLQQVPQQSQIWNSHGDHIIKLGPEWKCLGSSENSIAIIKHTNNRYYGVQFHLEVNESQFGKQMLANLLTQVAQLKPNWFLKDVLANKIAEIQAQVQNNQVILGLSGGVDSSVTAALIAKAINNQLTCIFIDNGLLRKNEAQLVMQTYQQQFNLKIICVDAAEQFYAKLKNVIDPEQKRKIIGQTFIEVFEQTAAEIANVKFLAQGTIYPDVIESSTENANAQVIKSHHNVGDLPANLRWKLLEPLKNLFKDEVRQLGLALKLSPDIIDRHPFPGPGLAIRILGEVTAEKCQVLQTIDAIFIEGLKTWNLYEQTSQAAAILLPIKSVGVMGDNRTYKHTCVLRAVKTIDFMTAQISHLPWNFLEFIGTKIINEVSYVNRVVYDITSKPPETIEWE